MIEFNVAGLIATIVAVLCVGAGLASMLYQSQVDELKRAERLSGVSLKYYKAENRLMMDTLLSYIKFRFEVDENLYTTLCGVTFSHRLGELVVYAQDEKIVEPDMLKLLDEHGCHDPETCILNAREVLSSLSGTQQDNLDEHFASAIKDGA